MTIMVYVPTREEDPHISEPDLTPATPNLGKSLFSIVRSERVAVGLAVPHIFANSCSSCAHSTCSQTNCRKQN
jgi:hypothetical protein